MNFTALPSAPSPAAPAGDEATILKMKIEGWVREVKRRTQEMHRWIADDRAVDESALGTLAVNAELADRD